MTVMRVWCLAVSDQQHDPQDTGRRRRSAATHSHPSSSVNIVSVCRAAVMLLIYEVFGFNTDPGLVYGFPRSPNKVVDDRDVSNS